MQRKVEGIKKEKKKVKKKRKRKREAWSTRLQHDW